MSDGKGDGRRLRHPFRPSAAESGLLWADELVVLRQANTERVAALRHVVSDFGAMVLLEQALAEAARRGDTIVELKARIEALGPKVVLVAREVVQRLFGRGDATA